MKILITILVMISIASGSISSSAEKTSSEIQNPDFKTVVDSRGIEVAVPAEITRVATISDGLVEEMMYILGVDDTLVALGSLGLQYEGDYSYPDETGRNMTVSGGKHIALALSPAIRQLPLFVDNGAALNLEKLAETEPDIVIMRLGDSAYQACTDEMAQKTIERIESLGIPVVVLHSSNCREDSDPMSISDEIRIIGRIFSREDKAESVISELESRSEFITSRTKNIPENDKKNVLLLGLSSMHRTETTAGVAWGLKSPESYMVEHLINAKNAFRSDTKGFQVISYEQILSTNPDVIILGTAAGYHPPGELQKAPYYKALRDLTAVNENNIASLPYEPRNAARRLEYPLDLMVIAKTTYPELFADINLNDWIVSYYQEIFGVDMQKASDLRSAQLLDWCLES